MSIATVPRLAHRAEHPRIPMMTVTVRVNHRLESPQVIDIVDRQSMLSGAVQDVAVIPRERLQRRVNQFRGCDVSQRNTRPAPARYGDLREIVPGFVYVQRGLFRAAQRKHDAPYAIGLAPGGNDVRLRGAVPPAFVKHEPAMRHVTGGHRHGAAHPRPDARQAHVRAVCKNLNHGCQGIHRHDRRTNHDRTSA